MSEAPEAVDPQVAPLLAALAAIGGTDDIRPEAEILDDLDRRAAEIARIVGGWRSADKAVEIVGEIARLREAALERPEVLGALRERIAERRKALGVAAEREIPVAAERVLSRSGAPPLRHVPTGLPTLDRITRGGLLARRLHLIAGEPDAGKTALLVQIALYAARHLGWVVVIHSIDEPREWIEDRVGQAIGLSLEDLEANNPGAVAFLARFLADLPNLRLVGREDRFTVEDSAEAAEALRKRLGAPGVMLGYDSLQKVKTRQTPPKGQRVDPRELLELTVETLLDLALAGPIVLVTSEVPRSAYRARGAKDRTPEMAAAKGVGSAEYAVTTQMVLSEIAKGDKAGCIRCGVPKNKRGEKRVAFALERDPDRCTFVDRGRVEGDEPDDGEGKPVKKTPEPATHAPIPVPAKVERARLVLKEAGARGFPSLAAWCEAIGGKAEARRAAAEHLIRIRETSRRLEDGRHWIVWRDPSAPRSPEDAAPVKP